MDGLSQQQKRELVFQFWREHQGKGKAFTVHHFTLMGLSTSGLYSMLNAFQENDDSTRRCDNGGSGGWYRKITPREQKKLLKEAHETIGKSQRKLASKYEISKTRVQQLLKENGLHYRKRQ